MTDSLSLRLLKYCLDLFPLGRIIADLVLGTICLFKYRFYGSNVLRAGSMRAYIIVLSHINPIRNNSQKATVILTIMLAFRL
ncbi:hypothetical protein [Gimesia fumaroli]|uniref:hypothetical protein n=1 Tax=Gimesia fumaroli TaxID=2527976 RepID=UPI0011A5D683|nr:hypothetical protein [Gimesia fumaroli]